MRAIAAVLALALSWVAASRCAAESINLADDHELGLGGMIGGLTGNLSGFTAGVGTFDNDRVNQYALQLSVPIGGTNLDLDLRHLQSTTISHGSFSFDGGFFPGGANVDLDLTWAEILWRFHVLERRAMRLCLLAGGRVLSTHITASTTTHTAAYYAGHFLPEGGALLEAQLYPRARLYGLVKYFDLSSNQDGQHTLEVEGGLTYCVPAPNDSYIGWRLTGGVRYLDIQFTDKIGQPDQVQFDIATTGPFIEAARIF